MTKKNLRADVRTGDRGGVLRRFSWLSLVAIIAVFTVGSLLLADFLRQHFVHRDAALTMEFLQSAADAENEQAYRDGRRPDLRDRRFEEFFRNVARLPDVLRANIYARDGTLVWSSDPKIMAQPHALNEELEEALGGAMHVDFGVAGIDDPKPEHAQLSDRPVEFVELYVPLRDRRADNAIIGVAELYRVPTALFATIRQGVQRIWIFSVVGGALLYGALFWIVYGADRTIRAQRERLVEAERLAAIGELSAAVAHGIRNPLASIRTSAELCLTDEDSSVNDAARDIISEVDNLERWVRDLLTYSRPGRETPGIVDLHPVVSRAEQNFRREFERRHVAVSSALPSDLPAVAGDEALLEHVFCSLFANALEAMPTGGKLEVSALSTPEGVRVTVHDSGVGISPAQLTRLFTPYATTKAHGMGLGLALVRHIVRRFGGDISIESRPAEGTRVILRFNPAR